MPKEGAKRKERVRQRRRYGGSIVLPLYFAFGRGASAGADKPKQWATASRIPRLLGRMDVDGWGMGRGAKPNGGAK